MIKLLKLSFRGIGRFAKEQTIDFSLDSKLIQVDGKNLNTNGSSGSGKSTVFHALDYLLGINEIPSTALQSRITKETIWVNGEFESNGKSLIISRSKKDGLIVVYDGQTIEGNASLVEEKIEEIIGIPMKLFKKMIHKKQKEGGFFLNLTPKEIHEFLNKALGLGDITSKQKKIDEDIKNLNSVTENLKFKLDYLEKNLQSEKEKKYDKPILSVNPDALPILIKEKQDINDKLLKLNEEKQLKISQIPAPVMQNVLVEDDTGSILNNINLIKSQISEKENEIRLKVKSIDTSIADVKNNLRIVAASKNSIKDIAESIQRLQKEKEHIDSNNCPTCMQKWIGGDALAKSKNIEETIQNKIAELLTLKESVDKEPELLANLDSLQIQSKNAENYTEINHLKETLEKTQQDYAKAKVLVENKEKEIKLANQQKINEHNQLKNEIEQKYYSEIMETKNLLSQKELEVVKIEQEIKSYDSLLENYEKLILENAKNVQNIELQISQITQEQTDNLRKILIAQESKKLIKNYSMQIFQDSLDYIGEQASSILSKIPNMSTATIYFEGFKESKNGSIKDEVNPILNIDGEDDINIKTLSGGERTAIDWAVDLAVIDMIENQVGKGADFFIMDEPFVGLDELNISQCLHILETLNTNKKIVIVDHHPILSEMVNSKIIVERNGEESYIL